MFYSFKNCLIKINGDTIAATDVSLQLQASLEASRTIADPSIIYYAPNKLTNTLNLSYYITGSDTIKQNLGKSDSYISGNIGGIWFVNGAVTSYSIDGRANEPLVASAQIIFFEDAVGTFNPTYSDKLQFTSSNLSKLVLSGEGTGVFTNPLSLSYRATVSVLPAFEMDLGESGYRKPTRLQIDESSSELSFITDNLNPDLPFTGQKMHVNVLIFNFNDTALVEAFTVSGVISSKTITANTDNTILSNIIIKEDTLVPRPSITGIFRSESYLPLEPATNFGINELVLLCGENLHTTDVLKLGNKPISFIKYAALADYRDIDKPYLSFFMPNYEGYLTIISEAGSDEYPTMLTINDGGIPNF